MNENSKFLMELVHNLGVKLRSAAVCEGVRRIRYGYFTFDKALTHPEWSLVNILDNINTWKPYINDDCAVTGPNLEELDEDIVERRKMLEEEERSKKGASLPSADKDNTVSHINRDYKSNELNYSKPNSFKTYKKH